MAATALYTQAFQNTIRTLIGSVNSISPDDSVLNCNTLLSAVGMELPTIPADYWSVQARFFVVDSGQNALSNNITVNAPAGYTVNGLSSVTIAANGASYVIMASSNTNYVALYGGIIAGVTSTGLISVTNNQLYGLIATSAIIRGQFYLVTDAAFSDGGVIVQGALINQSTTVGGNGIFLNADYQGTGDYSNVPSYVNNVGLWYSSGGAPSGFVAGSVAVYNNTNYLSLTGTWATDPSTVSADWIALSRSSTLGYVSTVDQVRYNIRSNQVVYRADDRGNEVELYINLGNNSMTLFPWGNIDVFGNKVLNSSYAYITNSFCIFNGNILSNGRLIDRTGKDAEQGEYRGVHISGNAIVSMSADNQGLLRNLIFNRNANVTIEGVLGNRTFENSLMADVTCTFPFITTSISDKRCESGFSNFEKSFAPAFSSNTLTLDATYDNHIGIFKMGEWADQWEFTVNVSTLFPQTFMPSSNGGGNRFRATALGSAAANCHVASAFWTTPPPQGANKTLNFNASAPDYVVLQKAVGGTFNQVVSLNIMA